MKMPKSENKILEPKLMIANTKIMIATIFKKSFMLSFLRFHELKMRTIIDK